MDLAAYGKRLKRIDLFAKGKAISYCKWQVKLINSVIKSRNDLIEIVSCWTRNFNWKLSQRNRND